MDGYTFLGSYEGNVYGGRGSFMKYVSLFQRCFSKGRLGHRWLLAAQCLLVCHLPGEHG